MTGLRQSKSVARFGSRGVLASSHCGVGFGFLSPGTGLLISGLRPAEKHSRQAVDRGEEEDSRNEHRSGFHGRFPIEEQSAVMIRPFNYAYVDRLVHNKHD